MMRWYGGEGMRWRDDAVARWYGDEVLRWCDGKVVCGGAVTRYCGGAMASLDFFEIFKFSPPGGGEKAKFLASSSHECRRS